MVVVSLIAVASILVVSEVRSWGRPTVKNTITVTPSYAATPSYAPWPYTRPGQHN